MNNIVKIISTSIQKGVRQIKFLRKGKNDIQEVPQIAPFGIDSNPIKDSIAVYSKTLQYGEAVVIGYIPKIALAELGELRLYSTDSDGTEQTYTLFKNDGNIELFGNVDNMVRYSKLEEAFNELKSDFNNLVIAYNSHTHITTATVGASPTPGILAPTTSTGVNSTANILPAKINNIKTN